MKKRDRVQTHTAERVNAEIERDAERRARNAAGQTKAVIDAEKYALKVPRGDFDKLRGNGNLVGRTREIWQAVNT